jgi:hypothetical protein
MTGGARGWAVRRFCSEKSFLWVTRKIPPVSAGGCRDIAASANILNEPASPRRVAKGQSPFFFGAESAGFELVVGFDAESDADTGGFILWHLHRDVGIFAPTAMPSTSTSISTPENFLKELPDNTQNRSYPKTLPKSTAATCFFDLSRAASEVDWVRYSHLAT